MLSNKKLVVISAGKPSVLNWMVRYKVPRALVARLAGLTPSEKDAFGKVMDQEANKRRSHARHVRYQRESSKLSANRLFLLANESDHDIPKNQPDIIVRAVHYLIDGMLKKQ